MLLKFHYERGCKTFFKKHKNEQKIIKQLIDQAITKELATGMTKVKIAAMTRIEGKSIYEFRLNLKKNDIFISFYRFASFDFYFKNQ